MSRRGARGFSVRATGQPWSPPIVRGSTTADRGGGTSNGSPDEGEDPPREEEAREAEDRREERPGLEAVLDGQAEVLRDDPESGVVDVRESQAAEADGEGDEHRLEGRVARIGDRLGEEARGGEDRDGRRALRGAERGADEESREDQRHAHRDERGRQSIADARGNEDRGEDAARAGDEDDDGDVRERRVEDGAALIEVPPLVAPDRDGRDDDGDEEGQEGGADEAHPLPGGSVVEEHVRDRAAHDLHDRQEDEQDDEPGGDRLPADGERALEARGADGADVGGGGGVTELVLLDVDELRREVADERGRRADRQADEDHHAGVRAGDAGGRDGAGVGRHSDVHGEEDPCDRKPDPHRVDARDAREAEDDRREDDEVHVEEDGDAEDEGGGDDRADHALRAELLREGEREGVRAPGGLDDPAEHSA